MKVTYRDILHESRDGVATITINRPERLNALGNRTIRELFQALTVASRNQAIGVIVITGAGDKAFCAGGDIAEMAGYDRKKGRLFVRNLARLGCAFLDCPKPVVAMVNGCCIGGGNELQLFCDLTVASNRSVFAQVGPKVGSVPLWGSSQILPSLVGLKKAKEAFFLCRHYSAEEAVRMGMINRVVPEPELRAAVDEVCRELLKKSPQSIHLLKKALHREIRTSFFKDLKLLERIYGTREFAEGMKAFLEKREPVWRR